MLIINFSVTYVNEKFKYAFFPQVYYAGFTVKKSTEEKPGEMKKTLQKSSKCPQEVKMCVANEDNENDGRK